MISQRNKLLLLTIATCLLFSMLCLTRHATAQDIYSSVNDGVLTELLSRRDGISTYLSVVDEKIRQTSYSANLAYQLTYASEITHDDFYNNVKGINAEDFTQFASTFSQQYEELTNQTKKLSLKKSILQNALQFIDDQMINSYFNATRVTYHASNVLGVVAMNSSGALLFFGISGSILPQTPVAIDMSPLSGKVIDIQSSGTNNFIVLTSEGQVWGWGQNVDNALGLGVTTSPITTMRQADFSLYSYPPIYKMKCLSSYNGCYMIAKDGRLFYMGEFHQSGEKLAKPKQVKVLVGGVAHLVRDIGVSGLATGTPKSVCIISKNDSKIYCAGDNSLGQLGDGTTSSRMAPNTNGVDNVPWMPVKSDMKFVSINGGLQYFMAVGVDGNLYSWGASNDYRIGRVGTVDFPYFVPGPILLPFKVRDVCTANQKSITIFTDYSNNVYVLGTYNSNDFSDPYKPIQVDKGTITGCTSGDYTFFLRTRIGISSVYIMGKNSFVSPTTDYATFISNNFPLK